MIKNKSLSDLLQQALENSKDTEDIPKEKLLKLIEEGKLPELMSKLTALMMMTEEDDIEKASKDLLDFIGIEYADHK